MRIPTLAGVLMLAGLAVIYLADLSHAPVYFGGDEAHFAVGARAIATTGRNLNGDLLPVFFNLADPLGGPAQPWGDTWYQPMLFYLTAVAVWLLPFSEWAIRVPMALIGGVITPLLTYVVARRMLGDAWAALVAAAIIALAPTHVILSRQALDYVLPLPFIFGWLWCLHGYMQARRPALIVAAGFLLGVGCYSYIASWALMPAYLVVTWIVIVLSGGGVRPIVLSALAFAVPALAAPLWVAAHPEMLAQTAARYSVEEGEKASALVTYVSMFNPRLLFVRGGPSLTTATARSGFVLLPAALLLIAGVFELRRRRDWAAAVIAAGLVLSPLPAAMKGEPGMLQRIMYILPFFALLGGCGVVALWRSDAGRFAAALAIVAMPLQFGYFYYDYSTHYKLRSAFYYDPVAFKDVTAYLFSQPEAPNYYFTDDVDDAIVKWRYYTIAENREALLPRIRFIAPDDRPPATIGSRLITYDETRRIAALEEAGWIVERRILDVDRRPAAVILRKVG